MGRRGGEGETERSGRGGGGIERKGGRDLEGGREEVRREGE